MRGDKNDAINLNNTSGLNDSIKAIKQGETTIFVNKQRHILNHQNMPTQINDEKQKIKQ
jgi:hypothetical protein